MLRETVGMVTVDAGNVIVCPDSVMVDAGTTLVSVTVAVRVDGGRVSVVGMMDV